MNSSTTESCVAGALRRVRQRLAVYVTVLGVLASALALVALDATPASAELVGLPEGFLDETVVSGLPYPTAVAFTPQGDMFIALKRGEVRVVVDGQPSSQPFVDISEIVHDNGDRGLLGLAVHPEFPAQPYVYLLYTYDPPGVTQDQGQPVAGRVSRLERFTADPQFAYQRAVPGSGTVILGSNSTRTNIGRENDGRNKAYQSCRVGRVPSGAPIQDCIASDEDSHTIGSAVFAPDGSLFVTSGDGSNYAELDPRALVSQDVNSLNGKVLRIDPDTGLGLPDNPFYEPANPASNRSKVWSYGLRNPFRLTIEPETGAPWVGDVGWTNWEEVNTGKGANFGWPCYEGGAGSAAGLDTASFRQWAYQSNTGTGPVCDSLYSQGLAAVTAPIYSWDHSAGGASATGGAFYDGDAYPAEYKGALFFADYDQRWIRVMHLDENGEADRVEDFGIEAGLGTGPVQLLTGPDTNIYWVRYDSDGGEVRRIRYVGAGNVPPVAIATATALGGTVPLEVGFSSLSSYDPDGEDFSVSWDFGDGTPTSTALEPVHVFETAGLFTVTLTVTDVSGQQAVETVTVMAGHDPPLAVIDSVTPEVYAIGDTIEFTGRGSALDEPIPATEHVWELRLRHNNHSHFATPTWEIDPNDPNVSRGSIDVVEHGDETWYQVCLRVRGPSNVWDITCKEARPDRLDYTLNTEPPGLALNYEDEGTRVYSPAMIRPTRGDTQTVSVAAVQARRTFVGWSDGVASRSRSFIVGEGATDLTAIYENQAPVVAISGSTVVPAGGTVQLQADVEEPEDDVVTYQWFVDDEPAGTAQDMSASFAEPGVHQIKVLATDSLGAVGEAVLTVEARDPSEMGGGTFQFNYTDRAALLGAGWDFLSTTASGATRNTETTTGITYSSSGLNIQAGAGDLWAGLNNTANTLFRDLPTDWTSVEVDLGFAPTGNYQNAGIALHVNDDNYLQLYRQFDGGQSIGWINETGGNPNGGATPTTATSLRLRITRSNNTYTLAHSTNNGTTWTTATTITRTLGTPRLAIITGSNETGGTPPTATYRTVTITTPTTGAAPTAISFTADHRDPAEVVSVDQSGFSTRIQSGLAVSTSLSSSWDLTADRNISEAEPGDDAHTRPVLDTSGDIYCRLSQGTRA